MAPARKELQCLCELNIIIMGQGICITLCASVPSWWQATKKHNISGTAEEATLHLLSGVNDTYYIVQAHKVLRKGHNNLR